jgi:hypothetical protein
MVVEKRSCTGVQRASQTASATRSRFFERPIKQDCYLNEHGPAIVGIPSASGDRPYGCWPVAGKPETVISLLPAAPLLLACVGASVDRFARPARGSLTS